MKKNSQADQPTTCQTEMPHRRSFAMLAQKVILLTFLIFNIVILLIKFIDNSNYSLRK